MKFKGRKIACCRIRKNLFFPSLSMKSEPQLVDSKWKALGASCGETLESISVLCSEHTVGRERGWKWRGDFRVSLFGLF